MHVEDSSKCLLHKKSNHKCSFLPCIFSFPGRAAVPRPVDGKREFAVHAREKGYQLDRIT